MQAMNLKHTRSWEQTQATNAGKTQQKDRTKEHRLTNEEWRENTGLNTQEWLSNGMQVSRIKGEKADKDRKGEIMIYEDVIYRKKNVNDQAKTKSSHLQQILLPLGTKGVTGKTRQSIIFTSAVFSFNVIVAEPLGSLTKCC